MREIALDTETTGLHPSQGHRIIEIGCVEMENRIPTGNNFHTYINPERDIPFGAYEVHGISGDMVRDKPKFREIADDFLGFIAGSTLVIHNAQFDMNFINAELTWIKKREVPQSQVFCTLKEARRKFPGAPSSLDALCKRFGVDISERTKHGALLDAELLADMYLELMGGAQVGMDLSTSPEKKQADIVSLEKVLESRKYRPSPEELTAHKKFLEKIKNPVWLTIGT